MVYRGSTPRLKVSWRDVDESLLTPDSQEWKIYDSKDLLQDTNTDPTLESEGVYYWDYTIPADGETGVWRLIAKAVKGERVGISKKTFEVEEP